MNPAVILLILLAPLATIAQDTSGLISKLEAVRFAPLARQARIQGDVRLRFGSGGVMVISGHPLLVQTAVGSLIEIGNISEREIEATYHFVIVDNTEVRITKRVVKRGNRFERLILRAFKKETEKVVEDRECVENPVPPKNRINLTGNHLEVWIYATGMCVRTETSQIALSKP
jgi:hypothetical protein